MIMSKLMYLLLMVIQIFADGNSESRQNQNECILPSHPSSGWWSMVNPKAELVPGLQVPPNTILEIYCNQTYKLDGCAVSVCLGGIWKPAIGNCLKTCRPIYSTSTLTVTCTYKDTDTKNCIDAVEGTTAHFKCASFYEDATINRPTAFCNDGEWTEKIPDCSPVCGLASLENNPTLITGGKRAKRGHFPWQVALYTVDDEILQCGGSLLNERVVLTAAHCIADEEGNLYPKENYMVVVGNYYRKYNHSSEVNHIQSSFIYKMFVPEHYYGDIHNYAGDIAVIVTNTTFRLTLRVQPVCVDWKRNYERSIIYPVGKQTGYVTGWGLTNERGNISMELRKLAVPTISRQQCQQNLTEEFLRYLTFDKICAGYMKSGKSVCNGDSGGGLVFKQKNRFYIAGVVSLSPKADTEEGGCDSNQYSLYTLVYNYSESFILEKLVKFKPSNINNEDTGSTQSRPSSTTTTERVTVTEIPNGCILPQHPEFGRWSVVGAFPDLSPGKFVFSHTFLRLHCNQGHIVRGTDLITCFSGNWTGNFGKCSKLCPALNATNMDVACKNNDRQPSCADPIDGTIVIYRCAPFYESDQLTEFPIVCLDGRWNRPLPKCVPVCGKIKPASIPLIVGGNTVSEQNFPWHVSIYVTHQKALKCAGSLISERVVLTAGHCITDELGILLPKENFTIVAGNYYRTFHDSRDSNTSQFAEIQEMLVPRPYNGIIQNYFGDVALIVTKQPFRLSTAVMPVCVDWKKKLLDDVSNQKASISTWGYSEQGASSDVFKKLDVSLIPFDKCKKSVPEDFKIYLTVDKMCAGYLGSDTVVCKGEGGGGLVYKHNGRYYVVGLLTIVAVSSSKTCATAEISFHTRLNYYVDSFILPKVSRL